MNHIFSTRILWIALGLSASAPLAWAQSGEYEFRRLTKSLQVSTDSTQPVAGSAELSASAVDFGQVANHTTAVRQVLLTNAGGAPLYLATVPSISGSASYAAASTTCGYSLEAGASCLTEVSFSPTESGIFQGVLSFTTALANSPHQVTLSGTGFNPVSLAAAPLPAAIVGQAYSFDFKPLLNVSNETSPNRNQATWSLLSGSLPAGLSVNGSTGVLSGTPTSVTSGATFTVQGTYKNNQGQQVFTLEVNGFTFEATHLAAGANHTCAVSSVGSVMCWGANFEGQLGDGTTTNRLTPVAVQGLGSGVQKLAAGFAHTCALLGSGGVRCWGWNGGGQLGDGSTTRRLTPVTVSGLASGVAQIAAGSTHTCVVTTAGAARCWGANANGELGDGTTGNRSTSVQVSGLSTGVAQISAGNAHTCVVTTAGAARCWGLGANGQIGDGTSNSRLTPVQVTGLTSGVESIAAGNSHTCVIHNGGARCWGLNSNGQLGDSTLQKRTSSVQVTGLSSGVTSITAGQAHTCAIHDGSAKCWGSNSGGRLGNNGIADSLSPVQVVGLTSGMAHISTSDNGTHTCASASSGSVWCWGVNNNGRLGDGTITSRASPVSVNF